MAKQGLLIILSSYNIETYINVLCHACFSMGVKYVIFLHISGSSTGIRADQAEKLKEGILKRIKELAVNQEIYEKLMNSITLGNIVKTQEEDIGYSLVDQVQYLGKSNRCIIDITTTTKAASQIVLAACLVHGLRNLYEFHLYKVVNREQPHLSLYHNLAPENFRYIHISDKPALRRVYNSLARKVSLSLMAIVVSIIVLLISLSWAISSSMSLVTLLASAASLATVISLGLQLTQTRRLR